MSSALPHPVQQGPPLPPLPADTYDAGTIDRATLDALERSPDPAKQRLGFTIENATGEGILVGQTPLPPGVTPLTISNVTIQTPADFPPSGTGTKYFQGRNDSSSNHFLKSELLDFEQRCPHFHTLLEVGGPLSRLQRPPAD